MRSHTAHVTRAALVLLLATFGFTGGSLAADHSCARTCTSMRAVPLSVVVLQPHLNAVTPSPFSPNGDHRDDATVIHFSIPDQETVTYSVITAAAKVVDGPVSLGTLAAGAHVAAWNGQDNAKHRVADGSYTVVLNTSARLGSITARGTSRHAVQVDDTAPSLGAVSGGGATFYPYPDSYLDSWTPTVSVSEAATLSLSLYNSQNLPIQHLTAYHGSAGTYGLTWSGHTSKGTLAPAGTYHGFYRAQDLAGNLHDTATMIVHVSNLRLLNKTATFSYNGIDGVAYSSDPRCTQYGTYAQNLSFFPNGVWLDNVCTNSQFIDTEFGIPLPAALNYTSITLSVYGSPAINGPEQLFGKWWNYTTGKWDIGTLVLTGPNETQQQTNLGTSAAPDHTSAGHARVALVVPNIGSSEDYDLGTLQAVVHYQVLG